MIHVFLHLQIHDIHIQRIVPTNSRNFSGSIILRPPKPLIQRSTKLTLYPHHPYFLSFVTQAKSRPSGIAQRKAVGQKNDCQKEHPYLVHADVIFQCFGFLSFCSTVAQKNYKLLCTKFGGILTQGSHDHILFLEGSPT